MGHVKYTRKTRESSREITTQGRAPASLQLQRSIGNRAFTELVGTVTTASMRIDRTPDLQAAPPQSGSDPGYQDRAHEPRYRIRIVAHASPRWKGAKDQKEADKKNLALSRARAESVRYVVEELLAKHAPNARLSFDDLKIEELQDGEVTVDQKSRGSNDTLREAKGNRQDNDQKRRRVDVIIESDQTVSGTAKSSQPLNYRSTASKFWYVDLKMQAGASVGAAGSLVVIRLTNAMTGQSVDGTFFAGGGGPKASIGVNYGVWSDPTSFATDREVFFQDFDGIPITISTIGLNLFIGYELTSIKFWGMGKGAEDVDVSGFNVGTVGLGGSVTSGKLSLDGPLPPKVTPIKDSDKVDNPYSYSKGNQFGYAVWFDTEKSALKSLDVEALDSVVATAVASQRSQ